jgi:hypothetical protein
MKIGKRSIFLTFFGMVSVLVFLFAGMKAQQKMTDSGIYSSSISPLDFGFWDITGLLGLVIAVSLFLSAFWFRKH